MTGVRPAVVADLDRIVELEGVCVGPDSWSRNLLEQGLLGQVPTVTYLVATSHDAITGYAVASYVDDVVELQRIGVDPAARRGGIASVLVTEVIAQASAHARIFLEVREGNAAARALYERLGFVELARRPKYYLDGETALVLSREPA